MEYLTETKLYLSEKHSFTAIADLMGCTAATAKRRLCSTIEALIDYFEFKLKNIEFPFIKTKYTVEYSTRWQLGNCKQHSKFWLKIIQDYEGGVGSYKAPLKEENEMRISQLTVCEFRELMTSILTNL